MLPVGRPTEVFLYASPVNRFALRHPQSLGKLIAEWAVRAGKADDLKRMIAARRTNPLAELPATVLAAQLALAATDTAAAVASLKALAERLKRDASRATADLVCHVAIPALDRPQPEVAAAAMGALDSCTKAFENSVQPEPLASILLILARRQFKKGDDTGGRKRLDAYLDAMDRNTIRYSGDYPVYLRKQQFERVAAEFARAGLWTDALAALARFVDAPAYSGGDPPVEPGARESVAPPQIESGQGTIRDPAGVDDAGQGPPDGADIDFDGRSRHGARGIFTVRDGGREAAGDTDPRSYGRGHAARPRP